MNEKIDIENPFILPTTEEEGFFQPSILESNDIPRWPAGSPTKTKGEFGAGDKAHQERAKSSGQSLGHPAIDIVYPIGTPIYAMLPGKVVAVTQEQRTYKKGDPKEGNSVKIDHPNYGLTSFYGHLDTTNISTGQEVDQTSQIGTIGASGNAVGTITDKNGKPFDYSKKNEIPYGHVHFEIKQNGVPKNPRTIITGGPFEKKAFNRKERISFITQMVKEAEWKAKVWEDEDD